MSDAETPRRRGWFRRWLRRILWVTGSAILVVLGLLTAVLYSSVATRWLVELGVTTYDDAIAGSASIDEVDGALGHTLTLEGVRLADRDGRVLVEVDHVELGIDVGSLWSARVETTTLGLSGARVLLPTDRPDAFADLAPPGDDEPPPPPDPAAGLGPDLPVAIVASLVLREVELRQGTTYEDGDALARLDRLDLAATAGGRRAEARLELTGAAPGQQIEVEALRLVMGWEEPKLTLTSLEVASNRGSVSVSDAEVDFGAPSARVSALDISADRDWLVQLAGLEPVRPFRSADEDATLSLRGELDRAAIEAELELSVPGLTRATLMLTGGTEAPLSLRARLDASIDPRPLVDAPGVAPVDVSLRAELAGDPEGELDATLSLTCAECLDDGNPVSVALAASGSHETPSGRGSANLEIGDAVAALEAVLDDTGHFEAGLELRAPHLSRVMTAFEKFVGPHDVRGDLRTRLACTGEIEPFSVACDTMVQLEHGAPVEDIDLDAHVAFADGAVDLRAKAVKVAIEGATVELVRPAGVAETVVHYDPRRVQVDGLALRVATPTGSGRVRVQGAFGLEVDHALDVEVEGFDLAAIRAFAPDVAVGGRLDATLHLEGNREAPRLRGDIDLDRATWDGHPLGSLQLHAAYGDEVAEVRVAVEGGPLRRLDLRAETGLVVGLDGSAPGVVEGAPTKLDLQVAAADLEALGRVAGLAAPLAGTLTVDGTVRGSLARPRLELQLEGVDLAADGKPLGDLSLHAGYRAGQASAELLVTHPAAERLSVTATVPIQLSAAHGITRWRSAAEHAAQLDLEGLDLSKLSAWVPEPELAGRLDVHAAVHGSMVEPRIEVRLHGDALVVDERAVGDIDVEATYEDGAAAATAFASGAFIEGLGLTAEVPLTLSPARGEWAWNPDGRHRLDLAVVGLSVGDVLALGGSPLAIEGRGDARLQLEGPARTPRVEVGLDFEDVRYGGRRVGNVTLSAVYEDAQLVATTAVVQDATRRADLMARVPLELDLPGASANWRRDLEHVVELEASRLDRRFIEPFVEVSDQTDFALSVDASFVGSISKFDARVGVGGTLTTAGDRPRPVDLAVVAGPHVQSLSLALGDTAPDLLRIEANTELRVEGLLDGTFDAGSSPLRVRARADGLDLGRFEGLLPLDFSGLDGRLALEADVGGQLGAPTLDGRIRLSQAAVTVIPLRQRLQDIEAEVRLDRQSIELQRLSIRAGRGTISTSGRADFDADRGELSASVRLDADHFPIRRPGLPRMTLTTAVDTKVAVAAKGTSIDVAIGDSLVDVSVGNVAAPKAVPTSDAVRFVSDAPRSATSGSPATASDSGASSPSEPAGPPMNVRVRLVDPFRVVGPSVDMSWQGEVRAQIDGERVEVAGAFAKERGSFDLLGHRFDIETGRVTIPEEGGVIPYLDVIARTQIDGVEITATVRGRADAPELILSSSPAFSQSEIFTMLVTGSTDTQNADPEEVEAQAASMLAAFSNPALQRQLNEKLRVDRIGVTFGDSTDQPILSVGKNITQDLYAETGYHFNAPPNENGAELKVKYQIAPRWSVETFFGDAAAGGVDLFWGRAFEIRRRRKSTRDKAR